MMSAHPDWTTLNDHADGVLAAQQQDDVARHLEGCGECRARLERLRAVLGSAQSAAADVAPPAGAWGEIRARIEQQKVVPLPANAGAHAGRPVIRLAAAAVMLIVASSAVTVLVVNRDTAPAATASVPSRDGAPDVQLVSLPPEVAAAERGYLTTVEELTAALEESRALLAPETVQAVERSLRVIDDAIAEAREALLNDPSNLVVRDLLRKGYEQKVDLLRRTAARLLET